MMGSRRSGRDVDGCVAASLDVHRGGSGCGGRASRARHQRRAFRPRCSHHPHDRGGLPDRRGGDPQSPRRRTTRPSVRMEESGYRCLGLHHDRRLVRARRHAVPRGALLHRRGRQERHERMEPVQDPRRLEGRRRKVAPALMLWVLLLLPAPAAFAADAAPAARLQPWRVVLIRSWDSQYAVNIVRERALVETMMQSAPRLIEIYTEEVDGVRFPSGEPPEFVAYLRAKYGGRQTDLVIASGNEPLEFAARHRDAIWPGAPILFNGVPTGTLPATLPPRTTGVTMTLDLAGTLRLGLALVPDARTVHFVSGVSEFDRMYTDLAREAARGFDGRLEAHFISGLSRADTLTAVEKVEPHSLVVYLTMLRDGTGQISGPGSDTIAQ